MGTAPVDYADVLELLRSRGLRMTPQRRAIVSEVMRTQGHISPAAIARTIEGEMPGVNPSTVYRTLALLEDVGVLQHSHLESGAEYHKRDEAQHVHLTCHRCGRDDALSIAEAGRLGKLIHQHHGFVADLTHFAITGSAPPAPRPPRLSAVEADVGQPARRPQRTRTPPRRSPPPTSTTVAPDEPVEVVRPIHADRSRTSPPTATEITASDRSCRSAAGR